MIAQLPSLLRVWGKLSTCSRGNDKRARSRQKPVPGRRPVDLVGRVEQGGALALVKGKGGALSSSWNTVFISAPETAATAVGA